MPILSITNHMLKFSTSNIPGVSLLIPAPSGIEYANQTGGYACRQMAIEGFLLPLVTDNEEFDPEPILLKHFSGPPWNGGCGNGISIETAAFIDNVLQQSAATSWLKVDQTKLEASHEAWIYMTPMRYDDTESIEFNGYRFASGIITWCNSD